VGRGPALLDVDPLPEEVRQVIRVEEQVVPQGHECGAREGCDGRQSLVNAAVIVLGFAAELDVPFELMKKLLNGKP